MIELPQTLTYSIKDQEAFRASDLVRKWVDQHPDLFDAKDRETALNQCIYGYHFFEWYTAIQLKLEFGLLSLQQKYFFSEHPEKHQVLEQLGASDLKQWHASRRKSFGRTQPPDLLVYLPDYSCWTFCEVKGPQDRLRVKQKDYFDALCAISGKKLNIVRLTHD
jgi:hypothetical protein